MRGGPVVAGMTAAQAYEAGFRQGRYERIGNWTWRMTMLVLTIVGFNTLVSGFGLFLLACMGYTPSEVEFWNY